MRTITVDEDRVGSLLAGDPAALADPFPIWNMLREAAPVVQVGPTFFVTRYCEVKSVLRDSGRFSSDSNRRGSRADHLRSLLTDELRPVFDNMWNFQALFMVATDGEQHDRLRRIAHRAFAPRRITELQQRASRYVDDFASALREQETGDLMTLAYQVPLMIIGDLLDVPQPDRQKVKDWSNTWGSNRGRTDERLYLAWEAMQDFRAYVDGMIERHRQTPDATDLVTTLIGAEHEERLTHEELAATFFVLLFAGHETTTNLISIGMLELLRQPEQWRLLCSDPDGLAGNATEELLRYVSPVQWVHRLALEDVELGGVTIPEGATVFISLPAANRDPSMFDEPDRLDITRAHAAQHIGFGFGEHYCLGVSLAKLEAMTAFRTLAKSYPDIELTVDPTELQWTGHAQLRALAALPVRAK
jgi:cytochrome P450